jgi:hypothetical protein
MTLASQAKTNSEIAELHALAEQQALEIDEGAAVTAEALRINNARIDAEINFHLDETIERIDAKGRKAALLAAAPLHPADDPEHLRCIRENVYGSPAEVVKYWDQYKIYYQYMTVD